MALERVTTMRPGDEIELLLRPDDVIHDDASRRRRRSSPGISRRAVPPHAGTGRAAATCWRWCPAITITASARRSAFVSSQTTSSRFDGRRNFQL